MTIQSIADLNTDIVDVRDIIERVDELRGERDAHNAEREELKESQEEYPKVWDKVFPEDAQDLADLEGILTSLCGCGGDEEWEGDWYPITLIAESYFTEYAQELAEDCGMVPKDMGWPCCHIDWEAAAEALKADYSVISIDGTDYLYR